MFVIKEDKSICLTRGDAAFFSISAKTDTDEAYKFQAGDVVRFKVCEKKACDNVVLSKDFGIEAETEEIEIYLEEKDTKIGDVISKPVDYWYEVELNPYTDPQTIIGYDEDGAKIFKLFPEGSEAEDEFPITPEDIPVVDEELSLTSTRPVQNQAITRAILTAKEDVNAELRRHGEYIEAKLSKVKEIEEELERIADETEVKLSRLDEFATELERFDEIEAKLTKVDVEDITNDFATMLNGSTMDASSRVYKTGDLIHGSLIITIGSEAALQINEKYMSDYIGGNMVYGTLTAGMELKGLGMFAVNKNTGTITLITPTVADIGDLGGKKLVAFINFTYICA